MTAKEGKWEKYRKINNMEEQRKTKAKPHRRGLQANLVNSAEFGLNVGGKGRPRGVVGEKRGGERMLGPSIQ